MAFVGKCALLSDMYILPGDRITVLDIGSKFTLGIPIIIEFQYISTK